MSTFFPANLTPGAASHEGHYLFALRFKSTVAAQVIGVRFYSPLGQTGTGVALFTEGVLPAMATKMQDFAAGWNEVDFATPVSIPANANIYAVVLSPATSSYTALAGEPDAYTEGNLSTSSGAIGAFNAVATDFTLGGVAPHVGGTADAGSFKLAGSTGNRTWYGVEVVLADTPANDITPPSVPSSVTVTSVTQTSGVLTFSASTDNVGVTGYEYTLNGGTTTQTATSGMTLSGLTPSTTYTVQVRAKDAAGNASAWSAGVQFTTSAPVQDSTAPTSPTGLASSAVSSSGFTVSWTASTDNVGVTGYEYSIDSGSTWHPATSPQAVTGLSPDADYTFRVRAFDAAGNRSAAALITVHTAEVIVPSNATITLKMKDSSGHWVVPTLLNPITGGGSGSVADPDYVFRPEAFGARGDGVYLNDVVTSSGSAVINSASASFTQADVGKSIIITDAGAGGSTNPSGALIATITSVQSAHTVTLSKTAGSAAQSAASAVYGTDDAAAFLAMSDAMTAYLKTAQNPHAVARLKRNIYCLATKPPADTTGTLGRWSRAQVPIPTNPSLTARKWVVEFQAEDGVDGATFTSWHQTEPQISGCVLFSMVEVYSGDPTNVANYALAVIGGPRTLDAWGNTSNSFNNVLAVVDGVRVMCPHNPGQTAFDMFRMGQYSIGTASADIFAAPHGLTGSYMKPTNANGSGFITNFTGLNDRCTIDTMLVQGYYVGMTFDEHCAWREVSVIYSHQGLVLNTAGGNTVQHGAWIGYASVEISDYPLYVLQGSGYFGLVIDMLDNEGGVTEHIHDPGNFLHGQVNLFPSGSVSSGPVAAIINGAGNLRIYNLAANGLGYSGPSA